MSRQRNVLQNAIRETEQRMRRPITQTHGDLLAQDEESGVVYGMPKAAFDNGIADAIMQTASGKSEVAA